MDVKEARYMLAIAQHKSINKASKALYISQPSLSKYLQSLEYKMNVKLFQHIHGEYIPTYIGKRYLHYAKKLLQIENEWEDEIADIKQLKKGEFSIAIPILRSSYVIPKTITQFHKRYPNIKVNIYEAANTVEKALENTMIDIVIYNTNEFPKHLDYVILDTNEIVLVARKDHPIVQTAISKEGFTYPWIDVTRIKEEPIISLYQDQSTSKVIDTLLLTEGIHLHPWMHTRSSEVALKMVQENTGIAFISDGYMKQLDRNDDLIALSIGHKKVSTTMIAAYRHGQYLSEFVKEYFEITKEYLQK